MSAALSQSDDRDLREVKERLLILQKEALARQADDPLLRFDPFPVQKEFVESVIYRRYQENYYIGANRSGKSDAGAYCGATLARFGYPDSQVRWVGAKGSNIQVRDRATAGWVSAIDFPTCRDTIQPKYFDNGFTSAGANHAPFIPEREIAEWRVSDQVLKLKNGSLIGFKSADSGRAKYQGAEKDWIHFDEEHPESIYEEAMMRVGARPLNIFTTCTLLPPEGMVGGISWLFNRIVKPWQRGELDNVGIYTASIYDNPYLAEGEVARLESKYAEGSVQRRIRLNGELIAGLAGSRIYASFDPRLNIRRQPEIALRRPLAWLWDFNVEPMITLIGQRERHLFRVYKELVLEEGNIQEMCDLFRMVHPMHMAEVWVYGDATGRERHHQSKKSSYQLILNSMMDYPAPVKLKVPESNPGVPDRINAINRVCKNEYGEVMLEIDPECEEVISDLEQVLSDGKGGIKKTSNRKDPYYRRSHASDALGYWVAHEAPIQAAKPEQTRRTVHVRRPGYHSTEAPR